MSPPGTTLRRVGCTSSRERSRASAVLARSSKTDNKTANGLGMKAAWVAAEVVGKVTGGKGTKSERASSDSRTISWDETLAGIRTDYAQNYFVSGAAEMDVYDPDCEFSDPFVSFRGTERFKQNVSNLGRFLDDVDLKVAEKELETNRVKMSWRFKAKLLLPWKPILAASGTTEHIASPDTGLVVQHIEAWDVDPGEVIKRLLKPSNRIPQSEAEVFMASVSSGDAWGAWQAASGKVLLLCAPVITLSLGFKLFTGEGLPGFFLGSLEGVSWLLALFCVCTELSKVVRDLTGGEGR